MLAHPRIHIVINRLSTRVSHFHRACILATPLSLCLIPKHLSCVSSVKPVKFSPYPYPAIPCWRTHVFTLSLPPSPHEYRACTRRASWPHPCLVASSHCTVHGCLFCLSHLPNAFLLFFPWQASSMEIFIRKNCRCDCLFDSENLSELSIFIFLGMNERLQYWCQPDPLLALASSSTPANPAVANTKRRTRGHKHARARAYVSLSPLSAFLAPMHHLSL